MSLIDKIFRVDYSELGLKPIEQLLFLRISYAENLGGGSIAFSIAYLCNQCNCTKPTIHAALNKLEFLGLILIKRNAGTNNVYSLNLTILEPLFPKDDKSVSEGFFPVDDFPFYDDFSSNSVGSVNSGGPAVSLFSEQKPLLTKNQRKRLSKSAKRR